MKTQKITRKLSLNKQTISNLKDDEMNKLNGGTGRSRGVSGCFACTGISWCEQCVTDEYVTCLIC